MQVGIRLVEPDGCRLITVQKGQQGQRLVETGAPSDDIEILVVLTVLDGDVDILGRVVSRLMYLDREPTLDDLRQFLPVRRHGIALCHAPIRSAGRRATNP